VNIEEAIAAKLVATGGVAALAGTRVWVLKLPQNPVYPAVRVQLISEPREYHLRGDQHARRARVQVDDYVNEAGGGNAYSIAVTLADAIDTGIATGAPYTQGAVKVLGCFRDNRVPVYEAGTLKLVRMMQDFIVWWQPV
jgi:hypothetical protein